MADLIREHDWASTRLGPIEAWSETLVTSINLMLASPFPTAVYWGDELCMFYNDAYLPILAGKHPGTLGRPAKEVWPEAWHTIGPIFEGTRRDGRVIEGDEAHIPITLHGKLEDRWWTFATCPIYSGEEIVGVYNLVSNETKARSIRRELEESKSRLDQVLAATSDAVVAVNRDWRFTYLNAVAVRTYGVGRDLIGKRLWEEFPDAKYEGSPYVEHYERAMYQGVAGSFEAYYPHPLNIWIQLDVHPTPDGIVTFSQDITQRKRAAAILDESAKRLRALVSASSDSVYRMSADWSVMHQLKTNVENSGFLTETEEANPCWLEEYIHPEDHSRVLDAIHEAVRSKGVFDLEHRVRQPDDALGWAHSRAVPLLDEHGNIREWFGMAADITASKRATEALVQNEKLAAMGRLAASIAHEVNNPLESVTNLIYLARQSAVAVEVREYLEQAEQELSRASAITSHTLQFHKQSSSAIELQMEDLLRSVLLIQRGRIQNADVRVQERFHKTGPVRCFEGEIRQVLNNLVSNATDAMRMKRGCPLFIRSRQGRDWRTSRKGVIVTIADTGTGMDPLTRQRVFDAFYTTKGNAGTGLGLWISQQIVARHNGILRFRTSDKPQRSGTVFTLFLPYDAASRPA